MVEAYRGLIFAFVSLWFNLIPLEKECGYATYYAPLVAERVITYRIQQLQQPLLRQFDCHIALNRGNIGHIYLLIHKRGWRVCQMIDVVQAQHLAERQKRRYVVELDYRTYWQIAQQCFPYWKRRDHLPQPLQTCLIPLRRE